MPTSTSTCPFATRFNTSRCSPADLYRDSDSTVKGYPANRSRNVRWCCSASTVVGTSTATCLPYSAALNAARIASSVFPNPTSPHTSRSIGLPAPMSRLIDDSAVSWSSVSS